MAADSEKHCSKAFPLTSVGKGFMAYLGTSVSSSVNGDFNHRIHVKIK